MELFFAGYLMVAFMFMWIDRDKEDDETCEEYPVFEEKQVRRRKNKYNNDRVIFYDFRDKETMV